MVTRILTEMFRFGLFDKTSTGSPGATVTTPAHQPVAQQVATVAGHQRPHQPCRREQGHRLAVHRHQQHRPGEHQ